MQLTKYLIKQKPHSAKYTTEFTAKFNTFTVLWCDLPFGGVILLTSESDDLRTCVWGETTLTGDVAHLMIWEGGEEGVADSSGRGELKGKLNADWLLETTGGAEGGGDMETDFLTGVWGGVIVK